MIKKWFKKVNEVLKAFIEKMQSINAGRYTQFNACLLFAWIVGKVSRLLFPIPISLAFAFVLGVLLGLTKELRDGLQNNGDCSREDIKASVYGALAGAVMSI